MEKFGKNLFVVTLLALCTAITASAGTAEFRSETDKEIDAYFEKLRGKRMLVSKKEYRNINLELKRLERLQEKSKKPLVELSAVLSGRDAARTLLEGDDLYAARDDFEDSIKTYPNPVIVNVYFQYFYITGHLDDAIAFLNRMVKKGREIKNQNLVAVSYGNLGTAYIDRGFTDRAEIVLKRAVELDTQLGNKAGIARHYGNLCLLNVRGGNLKDAENYNAKATKLEISLGNKEGLAVQKWYLSVIRENQKRLVEALSLMQEARRNFVEAGIGYRVESAEAEIARLKKIVSGRR